MLFLMSFFACEELLSEKSWNDTSSTYSEEDYETVIEVEVDTSVTGDLSTGEIIDISWAESSLIACWPGNENINFEGAHVFYQLDHPAHTRLTARVIPDDEDLDVNVYILQYGFGDEQIPPDVTTAVTCEAGYPWSTDSNPGEVDSTFVDSVNNDYAIVIGVAGPQGVVSGGYTLETILVSN